MKTKAVMAAVLNVLLIGMLVLSVFMLPVSATFYYNKFTDVDGGSHSDGGTGLGMSESNHDTGNKWLEAHAIVFGIGDFWAESQLYKEFTYTHGHDGYNWIELRYFIHGEVGWVFCDVECKVKVIIKDMTQGAVLNTITDVNPDMGITNPLVMYNEHRTVKFQQPLINGHTYRVTLKIRGECSAFFDSAGSYFNFQTDAWRLEWKWLKVHHSHGNTITGGGQQKGVKVEGEWGIEQRSYDIADGLSFTSYNRECDINGWLITICDFTGSHSAQVGNRDVDVNAWGPDIPRDSTIWIHATQWLEDGEDACPNSIGLKKVKWREKESGSEEQAIPDHRWSFGYPSALPDPPGYFVHLFTITNDDNQRALKVTGLSFLPTMNQYTYLSEISYTGLTYDFSLSPGESWTIPVITLGALWGGFIYVKYSIYNPTGDEVICNAWAGHLVTSPDIYVGGFTIPVDKLGLLAPYIGLASTIVVATVATAIYAKRVKRRKEKQ